MPRSMRSLLAFAAVPLLLGCGGDDDSADSDAQPDPEVAASQALTTAGDASAAAGSQLDEAPGDEDRTPMPPFGEVAIAITGPDGEIEGWCVLLADSSDLRQQGLMEVEDLGGYPGMLFVWAEDASSSFYMRNTPMPLSIAWFDADGGFVSETDMAPCPDQGDCPLYPAAGAYRFALEVPQGKLGDLGIEQGSTLRVGGECAPLADSS